MDGKRKTISLLSISVFLSVCCVDPSNARHSKLCYDFKVSPILEKSYDPLTHICCNGDIIAKNGIDRDCCAGKIAYDKQLEICCGTQTYRRSAQDGVNIGCCGNKTFRLDGTSFCCGNKNLFLSKGDGEGCCGPLRRDITRETCCFDEENNAKIHSNKLNHMCCGTKYFNTKSQECARENHVVPKDLRFCGKTQYNRHLQSCCNGNIVMEPMGLLDSCCRTQKYNLENEKCCDAGHVISSDKMCCGSGYTTQSQRCCQENVVNMTSPTQQCCGSDLFDREKGQGCCNFQNGVYDIYKEKCCNGVIVPNNGSCCGNSTHNTDTTVCCNEEYAVAKQQPNHNKCCWIGSVGRSYNDKEEICVKRNGMPIVKSGIRHCGDGIYTPGRDLCCASKLYSNVVQYGLLCCVPGNMAFNPSTELCCNSRVFRKTDVNSCDNVDTMDTNERENENDVYESDADYEEMPGGYNEIENEVNPDRENEESPDDDIDTENDVYADTDNEGICRICSISASEAERQIKQGNFDICHNNANKFNVKKETPQRQYQLLGTSMVNVYGNKRVRKTQRVHIPCTCRIDLQQVIIITDKPARKSRLFLDERDIVLPYSKEVRRQIRKVHKSKCKNKTDVKELLNDLKVYLLQLQLKVDKLENKVINKP